MDPIGIFLACPPGLEPVLCAEAREAGFADPRAVPGGVEIGGGWPDVWRANLVLRGAGRVLARIAAFRAMHPAQLDKRARKVDWAALVPPDLTVSVEATCRKSRIYHAGAAADRVGRALCEATGAKRVKSDAALRVMVRIDDDLCTISLDTSGAPLHQRGHKVAVGKAPLRETLAALFLRQMGYDGLQTVADPMCGSGTIPIEAAEIAAGFHPGRDRGFAFCHLKGFDPEHWDMLRAAGADPAHPLPRHFGADRDAGAVARAKDNAERSGVLDQIGFACQPVSDFAPPPRPAGIVLVNPPYGARIGNRKLLFGLYGALGGVLKERFAGWRVGIITSDDGLAKASGLPFLSPGPPVAHGGLRVKLWRTDRLP